MAGTQHFSPDDIQFQLVYDRGQCAESSYLNKTGSKFSELFQNLLMKHNNNKILLFHENLLATKTKSKAFKPKALFNVLNKLKNLPSKQNLLSKMACPVHQFWVPSIWKLQLYREIDPAE